MSVPPAFGRPYLYDHIGWLPANMHFLSNMYGLFMLGPYVEKLYGSARSSG